MSPSIPTTYYGIDLHTSQFTVHAITKCGGRITERQTVSFALKELPRFISELTAHDIVCVEASNGAFSFAQRLCPYVTEVIVIDPFAFKALYMTGKKTDKIDAGKLAEFLYLHKQREAEGFAETIPRVYIPDDAVIQLRQLFSTYNVIRRNIVRLKNRIHSLLKQHLVSYESATLFRAYHLDVLLKRAALPEICRRQILCLRTQLEYEQEASQEIKNMIMEIGYSKFEKEITLLISIMGVSPFTACAVMTDIADIARFKGYKQLCSYLQAGMRVDSSAQTTHNGKLNKKARKLAFRMLLQGVHHAMKNSPVYSDFYRRKTKGKSKGKVRCAVVRKIIVGIYYMLKNKETWKYCNAAQYNRKLLEMSREKKRLVKQQTKKAA